MYLSEKNIHFRALVLITTPKLAEKAAGLFKQKEIPVQYEWNAVGTASSKMMDVLGLGNPEKQMLISFMPQPFADVMLSQLQKELRLGTFNSGVAFTLPLNGANNLIVRMLKPLDEHTQNNAERRETIMSDSHDSLIAVIVNQGYSEDVMETARAAGAGGGTVVPSRRVENEPVMGFWGTSIQNEKDMVLIVVNNENKLRIMQEISKHCGMHSEAQGILVSLPIEHAIGLESGDSAGT